MKRTRHRPEQIVKKLRDADAMLASGKTIGQVCQALEVSEQTFTIAPPRAPAVPGGSTTRRLVCDPKYF
jgi:hypothetical protein